MHLAHLCLYSTDYHDDDNEIINSFFAAAFEFDVDLAINRHARECADDDGKVIKIHGFVIVLNSISKATSSLMSHSTSTVAASQASTQKILLLFLRQAEEIEQRETRTRTAEKTRFTLQYKSFGWSMLSFSQYIILTSSLTNAS